MSGSRIFYACIVLLSGFIGPVIAQCDGTAVVISAGNGEIPSPNLNFGGEYGKAADCTWKFSPPSDGKEYALLITVERLKLYVLKEGKKHCFGSYNLTIDTEQTKCDRYVQVGIDFCMAYYSSPTCAGVSKIQGCETRQPTSFPVPVRYNSDGRRIEPDVSASMYFKIRYEFMECPKEQSLTTTPTIQNSTSDEPPFTTNDFSISHRESATSAPTVTSNIERVTSSVTDSPATLPFQTSTIILSVVVAVLVLIIIAGGVFIWKRILAKKPLNTNKTGQQELPDGIYDNDPSPSNQENRAYEEITEYETVRSANVEEDAYITPNATPTGGEYEVPIQLAPRQYENVA